MYVVRFLFHLPNSDNNHHLASVSVCVYEISRCVSKPYHKLQHALQMFFAMLQFLNMGDEGVFILLSIGKSGLVALLDANQV